MIDQPKYPTQAQRSTQLIDLKTVFTKYFYHWPLFAVFLIIVSICAILYLKLTKPVYEISATILVKDEKKSPQEKSGLEEIDLNKSPKNAETEVQVLTSKKLIAQVVTALNLNLSYTIGEINQQLLYQNSPVELIGINRNFRGERELSVLIEDEKTVIISGVDFATKTISFNQYVNDELGRWKLVPTTSLKQYVGKRIRIHIKDTEKVIKNYTKALDARLLDKSTPTIGLFVTDVAPQRGRQFLNALISAYNMEAAKEEKRITKSTIEFIDQRLLSLTKELNNAEEKVEGYRSSEGITDLSSQSKVYLENVQANETKLNNVNVQLSNIDGIENYVNSSNNRNVLPATQGIADEVLNGLIANLSQLQLKRAALLTTTPEGNPLFEPINMQIKTTKIAIKDNIAGKKASLRSEKQTLQSINQGFESTIKEIPGQERQYVGMKRQETIKENLYVYLLQKREELALSYASTQADARIVDQANIGDVKWPRPILVVVMAVLLALGLPFMIIYFRYVFNQKITSKQEIEDELDVTVLGEISYQNLGKDVVIVDNHRHIIGEQFRSIRTNVYNFQRNDHQHEAQNLTKPKGKITLCTSSTANEGKSFVASNLAMSFASSGRKTVLLEMDLRKPRISAIFKLSKEVIGISEFLSSSASIEDILQPSGLETNLHVVASGKILNNPSELLEGPKLVELIDYLKGEFDEIIIDSPPLHLVTDAMIIARFADLCLYIIRQGHTSKQELEFIGQLANANQLPNMHIIFNGITQGKYGYSYNYDTSYYLKLSSHSGFNNSWKFFISRI